MPLVAEPSRLQRPAASRCVDPTLWYRIRAAGRPFELAGEDARATILPDFGKNGPGLPADRLSSASIVKDRNYNRHAIFYHIVIISQHFSTIFSPVVRGNLCAKPGPTYYYNDSGDGIP